MVFGIADGVVLDFHCRQVANEFLAIELVQREAVTTLGIVIVVLNVGHRATSDLQHHIVGSRVELFILIERLKVLFDNIAVGNNVATEIERNGRDENAREHVGAHEPFK